VESIPNVGYVTVEFSEGTTVCNNVSKNIVQITFLDLFGPLPPLVPTRIDTNEDATLTVGADDTTSKMIDSFGNSFFAIKGTKENGVCSNRGICDHSTGTCLCFDTYDGKYAGSNGYGNAGDRGDCGFAVTDVPSCPGGGRHEGEYCSDHGVCDQETKKCTCEEGFTGGDCSLRVCPFGLSWFSYPSSDDVGHDEWTECSNMGICERDVGECNCHAGFFGAACEYMSCSDDKSSVAVRSCSGHGTCITIKTKARLNGESGIFYGSDPNNASTWDADRLFGCQCDDGFEGYDCSLKSCYKGKDPLDPGNDNLFVCSNHGLCDTSIGSCKCFRGWGDSDGSGTGTAGIIDDCGRRLSIYHRVIP